MTTGRRSWRDRMIIFIPLIVTLAAFLFAYLHVDPPPPREIELASGVAGRGYHLAAESLREGLAKQGITLHIRNTVGSSENVELLEQGEVDIAFVQSGVGEPLQQPTLRALGSVYLEPLWVIHRTAVPLQGLRDIAGRRVILGALGSGTRAIAETLLHVVGLSRDEIVEVETSADTDLQAMLSGSADVMFLVAPPTSEGVRELLESDALELLSLRRAEAYSRRLSSMQHVTIPEGLIDLGRNLPPRDIEVLAPAATLVVSESFHPALTDLVLMEARRIFGERGLLVDRGEFPAATALTFPLSEQAHHFYQRGPSFLHAYLPFWAANTIERLLILMLPFLTLLIPLLRVVPPIYQWRIRRRIKRWYTHLRELERRFNAGKVGGAEAAVELARWVNEVDGIEVPASHGDELYQLRLHLRFVSDRFAERE